MTILVIFVPMKRYSHFIFDVDGTLLDTERTGLESLRITILELTGKNLSMEELLPYFGLPSSVAAREMGYPDPKVFGDLWETHFQELYNLVKPFPGMEDTLRRIKAAGIRMGLCTSRSRFEFDSDPHLRKMLHLFDWSICFGDCAKPKPAPDPLLAYMEKASSDLGKKVNPEECLLIGDTTNDFFCARSAGCDFALADWKGRGMQGMQAQYHITCANDLLALLK